MALAPSTGHLHKYSSELMGLGFDWKVIKSKTEERFSEFGSSIVAQNKLTSFTQNTMAMYEHISEFTSIMEHAHSIKPTDTTSAILASNFIDGIQNPYIKNKLRSYTTQNLSELYGFALKEDQKQKIREPDFGTNSSQQQTIAHCDINAHFIKDCPQNRLLANSIYRNIITLTNNNYVNLHNVTNLGLHNKLILVTQKQVLELYITAIEHKTLYGLCIPHTAFPNALRPQLPMQLKQ